MIALALFLSSGVADADVIVLHGADDLKAVLQPYAHSEHPLVVHFFATWCDDCVREMPILRKAVEAVRALGASILFVSLDDPKGGTLKVERLLKRFVLDVPVYILDAPDPAPVASLFTASWSGGLPASFVMVRGERRASFLGPLPGAAQLAAAVRHATEQTGVVR